MFPEQVAYGNCTVMASSAHYRLTSVAQAGPTIMPFEFGITVRRPQPLNPIYNIVAVLDLYSWLLIILSLTLLSWALLFTYVTYLEHMPLKLLQWNVPYTDFFIKTFSALTESDPMTWFEKYTAGKCI